MSAEAQQQLTAQLLGVLQSQWNNETYTSYYDEGWCLNQNVTYSHRVDAEGERAPCLQAGLWRPGIHAGCRHAMSWLQAQDAAAPGWRPRWRTSFARATPPPPAENFNFCSVPLSGSDAFLFAALALLVASVCMGKLQSVWVLVVGAWEAGGGAVVARPLAAVPVVPWLASMGTMSRMPMRGQLALYCCTRLDSPVTSARCALPPALKRTRPPAGGCLGILNYEVNLYRLGNAISLWLGIQPPDLFFYAFLPPLLLDSALSIDYFLFHKVCVPGQ